MFNSFRPLWAEINIDNIIYNVNSIKNILNKGTEYISVIKADAYGHGAVKCAEYIKGCGINYFAVAMLDEAIELRNAGIDSNIIILGFTPYNMAKTVIENNISQTCYSYELAKEFSDAAVKLGKTAKLHIAVDTGMKRIGFEPTKESIDIIDEIQKLSNVKIEGLFTHFAVADAKDKSFTYEQFRKYNDFLEMLNQRKIDIGIKHVGNSAEIIDLPKLNLDAVRPGIIQYGLYPSDEVIHSNLPLKPVMSLKANIINIKEVEKDTSISYGRKFFTKRKSIIATIPVGYADGYSRLLSGKAMVIVNGQFAPVVGVICMDQCMIDITDINNVSIGDEVILIGNDGKLEISVDHIAKMLGTINYEVICMISRRVPRVYTKDGKIIDSVSYLQSKLY